MKANPEQNVAIIGYADKDTGTSEYNMGLSKRRAQSVYDALTEASTASAATVLQSRPKAPTFSPTAKTTGTAS